MKNRKINFDRIIELLLTGCIDNCSISFSLKNNLFAFITSVIIVIIVTINKNKDINASGTSLKFSFQHMEVNIC